MNCVELAHEHARRRPDAMATWLPGNRVTSFGELLEQSGRAQSVLRTNGVDAGDVVLLLDGLGPRLYATAMAVLAMGASVMLVEPWMPVRRIETAVRLARPRVFVGNWLGYAWGARVPAIREIDTWVPASSLAAGAPELDVESVDPDVPGIITFTSGTTGAPKGVVRSQGYLVRQHEVLSRALGLDRFTGPDLCIFANFVFANLASGRGSVIIPPRWKGAHLRQLDRLVPALGVETLTCGPGFLLALMREARAESLRSIHVGGALTDCWILEEGFRRWPEAEWLGVYGSTEAEPVAVTDARDAVVRSRDAGYFQNLYLGTPVAEIEADLAPEGLWVAGPHVCPLYLGDVEENRTHKRRDEAGRVWHFMGDRIRVPAAGDGAWWYAGRSGQKPGDFELEQQTYALLQSSKAFVHRRARGEAVLVGEHVTALEGRSEIAGVDRFVNARIYRDRRHRARIDREKTLKRRGKWLLG